MLVDRAGADARRSKPRCEQVLTRKADIAPALRTRSSAARRAIDQIGRDQARVRENMRSLKGSSEERQLMQRYVKQLDEQETRIETIRREVVSLTAERAKAQAELDKFIEGIAL